MKDVFIEYLERDKLGKDRVVSGYFKLISENSNSIKVRSGKNFITIPMSRLLKMKEKA